MIPESHQQALTSLSDATFLASLKYAQQQGRADIQSAPAELVYFGRRYVALAAEYKIPLFIHCCYRSGYQQDRLFDQGHSKAEAGQSPHNYGLAVDVVHGTRAWDLSKLEWEVLGHIGREAARKTNVKVEWGGEWKFYDPAHWQLSDWKERVKAVHGA